MLSDIYHICTGASILGVKVATPKFWAWGRWRRMGIVGCRALVWANIIKYVEKWLFCRKWGKILL